MATQPAVVRVLIIPIANPTNFSEDSLLTNSTIESVLSRSITQAAVITYVSLRKLVSGKYDFNQGAVIEITTTSAADITLTELSTLQTSLGLPSAIPTWSYSATWGY